MNQPTWEEAWQQFNPIEKQNIQIEVDFILLSSVSHQRLLAIQRIRDILRKKLIKTQNLKDLKELAQQLGVYGYSRMSKEQLVNATTTYRSMGRNQESNGSGGL